MGSASVRSFVVVSAAVAMLVATRPARAGLALDLSFSGDGKVLVPVQDGSFQGSGVAMQADGKIVVAGTYLLYNSNTSYDFGVARFLSDGTLDSTFGNGGIVGTDFGSNFQEFGEDVAIQPDGKIVVVGSSFDRFAVARYNTNGQLDTTFDGDGRVRTDVAPGQDAAMAVVLIGGKIVVAGDSNGFGIARYNANGSLDTTFAGDGTTSVRLSQSGTDRGAGVVDGGGGAPVVAGMICPGGVPCGFGVERFTTGGAFDGSFGDGGLGFTRPATDSDSKGRAIAVQPDGKLVVAGESGEDDFGLARFNADGTIDAGFGIGGGTTISFGEGRHDFPSSVVVQDDGTIITVGTSYDGGFSSSSFALSGHDSAGSPDPTFGAGGKLRTSFQTSSGAADVAIDGDRIVVVGTDGNSLALARYFVQENTPPGDESVSQPIDETTGEAPATLTFSDVTEGGDTSLETSPNGPPVPSGFQLGTPPTYYEITSTATFSSVEVCIHYTGVSFRNEAQLRLLHFENGQWINVTTSLDRNADIICGLVTSLSPFALVEDACVPGDVEGGDDDVDAADITLARRMARGKVPVTDQAVACGDLWPGVMMCRRALRHWCAEGDGALTLDDAAIIHKLSKGLALGCGSCVPVQDSDEGVVGDMVPDGALNIGDVVRALRVAVGLESVAPSSLFAVDLAPAMREDGLLIAGGDGRVTIADVVVMMRSAVGLETLAWPARQFVVRATVPTPVETWSVNVSGFPPWAQVEGVVTAACRPEDLLTDFSGEGWGITCVSDAGEFVPGSELAVLTYRAPRAVELSGITGSVQLVDADLARRDTTATLEPR